MLSRRQALRQLALGTGAISMAPLARQLRAEATGDAKKLPKRFVFVVRSNGVLTTEVMPQGLEDLVKTRPHASDIRQAQDISLAKHKLHPAMKALEPLKDRVTIFQGLSGKMCRGDHEAGFGALGAYAGKRTPRDVTIDAALAQHLGGVVPHIGFTMDALGSTVTYPHLSAAGPREPLPYYADPMLAYADLFGTIAAGGDAKAANQIDRNLLDFMVGDVRRFQRHLTGYEKEKLGHYLHGFQSLRERQTKLLAMKQQLEAAAPELRDEFTSEVEIERVRAHFDLAASSLIAGLTQVTCLRVEHLGMRLTGLGLGAKTVHHIGHMIEGEKGSPKGTGGEFEKNMGEFETRAIVMDFHMQEIARLAAKLKAVPEGDGTMLDNTVIVYLSDHGDRHHSNFDVWPFVAVGNVGGAFRTGRYIQYPGHGHRGNRTIANLYISLLHAAGRPVDSFGQKDLESPDHIDQTGPLAEWMA